MYSLQDKIAIVTGGANGIGASIVKAFVKEGAKFVAIVDVTQNTGTVLEDEINSRCGKPIVHFFNCDITEDEQLQDVFDNVVKQHGTIDLVVNNAGVADDSKFKKLIEVNLTALVSSSLKALEVMRVDRGGKGGTIINMASITALSKDIGVTVVYSATKTAVLQFSNRIGTGGLYSHGKVRVLTICFGATDTSMLDTCKGIDDIFDEDVKDLRNKFRDLSVLQSTDEAAAGVVESYKAGASGSTWLINNSKALDITDRIETAYKIMSQGLRTSDYN